MTKALQGWGLAILAGLVRTLAPVILVVAVAAAAGLALAVVPEDEPEPIAYVALGDSLATGAGAERGYPKRYAERLEAQTGAPVDLTNLARDGATSADLLAVVDDADVRSVVATADVVTFAIGGNDLLGVLARGVEPTDAVAEFERNWDDLLATLTSLAAPDAVVATTDVYHPFVAELRALGLQAELQPYLDRVNDHIAKTAAERDVTVVSVYADFNGGDDEPEPVPERLIADDGLHPSDAGHERIAELLASATSDRLGAG